MQAFLDALVAARYSKKTRDEKARALKRFERWVRKSQVQRADIDESSVTAYLGRVVRRPDKRRPLDGGTVHQFLEHLRREGVARIPPERPDSLADALVSRYTDYLRQSRGLSSHSIAVYVPFVREFVAAPGLIAAADQCAAGINAAEIRGHLLDRARGRSSEYTPVLATALRSFLRFLFIVEETTVDLSTAVPPVRRWQFAAVPAFLPAEDVERVLAAVDRFRHVISGSLAFAFPDHT